MVLKDWIITLAALTAMLLGIYNFFNTRYIEKVRLKIIPKAAHHQGIDKNGKIYYSYNRDHYYSNLLIPETDTILSMEVINLSKFSVIVREVGLSLLKDPKRLVLIVPIIPDGGSLPYKLESRDSIIIHFDSKALLKDKNIKNIDKAYATTSCGKTCFGNSGALREFIRYIKQL